MKAEKKYLKFSRMEDDIIIVENNKQEDLGYMKFDLRWKRWVWVFEDLKMSRECLQQIVDKIRVLEE